MEVIMEPIEKVSFNNSIESTKEEPVRQTTKIELSGSVSQNKQTKAGRAISNFAANKGKKIRESIIIPAIKKFISDAVSLALYDSVSSDGGKRSSTRVSYSSYFDKKDRRDDYVPIRNVEYDDLEFDDRADAERIREEMFDIIERYHTASILDLYDLVGLPTTYTDRKYGWADIRSSEIIYHRGKWLLKMPRPVPLD